MADKKRQHYVPVFYLKFFASDPERKRISIYNLNSHRVIHSASLKRQAYKDNFYGSDKVVESAFEMLEGRSAEVISDTIARSDHPPYYTKEHHVILSFTVMLHGRTLYSADALSETIEKFVKTIAAKNPELKEHIDEVKIRLANPAQWTVQKVASLIHVVSDLGYKLIVNDTPTPFFTSDHPVVFYNQFMETRKTWGSNCGLASKGLQIFLPLSPKHQLIFFDKDVYKVSGIHHRPIVIKDARAVDSLNMLQVLNAYENLYFGDENSAEYVKSVYNSASSHKRAVKSNVNEFPQGKNDKGQDESIIAMSQEDVKCGLSLSFVTLTKEAKEFKMDHRAVYVRNPTITRLDDEFSTLVSAGVYKPSEFKKFFNDKYASKFNKN